MDDLVASTDSSPNETEPIEIDVICVGERAGLAAYELARERLGR